MPVVNGECKLLRLNPGNRPAEAMDAGHLASAGGAREGAVGGFEADGDGTVATTVATADGDGVGAVHVEIRRDAEAEAGPR